MTAYEVQFTTLYKAKPNATGYVNEYRKNMKALILGENLEEVNRKLMEKYSDAIVHQVNHLGRNDNFVIIL